MFNYWRYLSTHILYKLLNLFFRTNCFQKMTVNNAYSDNDTTVTLSPPANRFNDFNNDLSPPSFRRSNNYQDFESQFNHIQVQLRGLTQMLSSVLSICRVSY